MRVILSLLLCATVVGCGQNSSTSRLKDAQSDSVFLAVFGGNASCKPDDTGEDTPLGMDMYAPFRILDDHLTNDNGWNVTWLLTCHNSDDVVFYVTSDEPTTMREMSIPQVVPLIENLTGTNHSGHVFLAGHSYGGWLALKAGLALADDVKVEGLFSIDPISRPNCTFANPAECTQAPSDITHAQRLMLSERTDHWLNFYENQTFYLHSGPMPEADENIQVATGHTGMDTHTNVWTRLTTFVARSAY